MESRAFLNPRGPPLCSVGGAGRSKTRPCGTHHLRERVERLAFRQNGSVASASIGLAVGFRILRRRRTRGVQHHAFGPFMIRVDSDVDPLIERNADLWSNRCGEAPVRSKKRREQEASHPPKILKHRHDREPQRFGADCNSRRQASLKSRNGSISLISSGRSRNVLFGER